jgi:hypothetical protein
MTRLPRPPTGYYAKRVEAGFELEALRRRATVLLE